MIYLIKLSSGETVVTEMLSEGDDTITVANPLQLQTVNNSVGGAGLMTLHWIPLDIDEENVVDIRQEHVIMLKVASNELENFYYNSLENFFRRSGLVEKMRQKVLENSLAERELDEIEEEMWNRGYFATANTHLLH